ncbi:MAG TPA: helix-turn-helix domain-containing protein [Steroidobacteraceae bacterium]
MQHKGFDDMPCPIARSLERVGEWWSILILRDAFKGVSRFDQFQKSLGIAPNMLTRRLNTLVESGLLERRLYSEKPPRHEYVLTDRGRDFRPVLWALMAWGNKHFPPEGHTVVVVDAETGVAADPVLIDRLSGRVLRGPEFKVATVRPVGARARVKKVIPIVEHSPESAPSGARRAGAAAGRITGGQLKPRPAKPRKAGTSS